MCASVVIVGVVCAARWQLWRWRFGGCSCCRPFCVTLALPLPAPAPLLPQEVYVDGQNVVPDVWEVLDKIKDFSGEAAGAEVAGAEVAPRWRMPAP